MYKCTVFGYCVCTYIHNMAVPSDVPAEVECYHSLFPLEPESSTTPDKVWAMTYSSIHSVSHSNHLRMHVCAHKPTCACMHTQC